MEGDYTLIFQGCLLYEHPWKDSQKLTILLFRQDPETQETHGELSPNNLVQFSSVTQSCPTLCDSMDASTPGFSVHHQPPELARTHVHRVGDAIQPCPPLSSPSPAINLSQGQGLFQWSSLDPAYFPNDYLCISTLLKSPIVLMVEMSPLSNVKCRDQHLIGPYFGSTLRGLWN